MAPDDLDALQGVLDILDHPWQLAVALILSVLSLIFCWYGWRRKNGPLFLVGVAVGIPPLDPTSVTLWGIALLLCGLAYYRSRRAREKKAVTPPTP
jgi:hypothetical protein